MDLKSYIEGNKKTYRYTIKLGVDKVEPEHISCIEKCMERYEMIKLGKVQSTPPLEENLIFPNSKNCAIQSMEVETRYPVSLDALERLISEVLKIQRMYVVVFGENDPRKFAIDQHIKNKSRSKEDYIPNLGSDYEKTDHSDLHGEPAVKKVLDQNKEDQKNRKLTKVINPLSPEQVIDKSTHVDTGMGPINNFGPISTRLKGAK